MNGITKQQILDCAGMTRRGCADKLGVTFDSLRYLVSKYKMVGFFNTGNLKCPKSKKYYLSMVGVKTPEQIAEEYCVTLETVLQRIRKNDLNKEFGIGSYGKIKEEEHIYSRKVNYTCMTEGCRETFSKHISNDVSDKRAAGMRFRCSACNSNIGSATTYSYSGQGES